MTKDQQKAAWLVPHTKKPADWLQEGTPEQRRSKERLINHLKPRLPTEQERKEVVDYIMAKNNTPERERWMIETFFDEYTPMPLVVFDQYETNGFEYEGKLLVEISDTDPTHIKTYIWRNGKVEETKKLHKHIMRRQRAWVKHVSQEREAQPSDEKT